MLRFNTPNTGRWLSVGHPTGTRPADWTGTCLDIVACCKVIECLDDPVHGIEAPAWFDTLQPRFQIVSPVSILKLRLVVISYEEEEKLDFVRLPGWRCPNTNLSKGPQRTTFIALLVVFLGQAAGE